MGCFYDSDVAFEFDAISKTWNKIFYNIFYSWFILEFETKFSKFVSGNK